MSPTGKIRWQGNHSPRQLRGGVLNDSMAGKAQLVRWGLGQASFTAAPQQLVLGAAAADAVAGSASSLRTARRGDLDYGSLVNAELTGGPLT
jgi:hypothetical protein